ncbi:MAG TPA: 5-oxoprolinase subunit PxpA, partial [Candidatus Deferrimicrobium sp.]|nr:5-oxoprolinase subunit PxpA [Candidatus Deferrimicrobium sp.]
MQIDLNCDMGEGFGRYVIGNDEAAMPFVSSVNVACGFHASDPSTMRRTVRLAKEWNVAVGAHPSFPDRVGFGRREMSASPAEIRDDVIYQVGALLAFCKAEGVPLRHVKPHGALYNLAAMD